MNEKRVDDIPRSCLVKIRSVYDTVKSAERKAIDFILERPKEVAGLTIVEFAERPGAARPPSSAFPGAWATAAIPQCGRASPRSNTPAG